MASYYPRPSSGSGGLACFHQPVRMPSSTRQPSLAELGLTPRMGSVPYYGRSSPPVGHTAIPYFVRQGLSLEEAGLDPTPFDPVRPAEPAPGFWDDIIEEAVEQIFPELPDGVGKAVAELAHVLAPELRWLDLLVLLARLADKYLAPTGEVVMPAGYGLLAHCRTQPSSMKVQQQTLYPPGAGVLNTVNTCVNLNSGTDPSITPSPSLNVFTTGNWYAPGTPLGGPFGHLYYADVIYRPGKAPFPNPATALKSRVKVNWDVNLFGSPSGWTPGALASAMPLLAPIAGSQPEPVPRRDLAVFDAAARSGQFAWIMRQVGPDPGSSPQHSELQDAAEASQSPTAKSSTWGEVLDQPWLPPQIETSPATEDQGRRVVRPPLLPAVPPITFEPIRFGPPRARLRETKLRAPRWLIHALAVSTYTGATIRNLWKSLPDDCKSKMHRRKGSKHRPRRRYDSMLKDIYGCLGRLDWGKFAVLEAETLVKFALEGWALAQMNRITPSIGGGPVTGLGTQVMHTAPPGADWIQGDRTSAGGAWSGRENRFGLVDEAFRHLHDAIGALSDGALTSYKRSGTYNYWAGGRYGGTWQP